MATILELRKAGFTDDEIGAHVQEQSQVLSNAGFSVPEIEGHFGIQEQAPFTQADFEGKSIEEIAQIEQQRESLQVPLPVALGFEKADVTREKELQTERKIVAAEGRTLFEEAKVSLKKGGLNVVAGLGGTLEELARLADKPILNQLGDVGAEFALSARNALRDPKLTATDTKGMTPAQKTGFYIARVVPETLSFMVGTVAATVLGGPVAGGVFAFSVEGENAFQDALVGGATKEQANIDRLIVGTINAVIEQSQTGNVLRFGKKGLQTLAKLARDKTFTALRQFGKEVTLAGLKQFITEGLQEATQELVSIATPAVREGKVPDIDQALKQIGSAGLAGGVAGLVLGGGASGVNVLSTALDSKTQLAELAEPEPDIVAPKELAFEDIPKVGEEAKKPEVEPEPTEKAKKQIETLADIPKIEPTKPTEAKTPPTPTVTLPKAAEAKPEAVEGEVTKAEIKRAEETFIALTKAPTPVKDRLKISSMQILREQHRSRILSDSAYVAQLDKLARGVQSVPPLVSQVEKKVQITKSDLDIEIVKKTGAKGQAGIAGMSFETRNFKLPDGRKITINRVGREWSIGGVGGVDQLNKGQDVFDLVSDNTSLNVQIQKVIDAYNAGWFDRKPTPTTKPAEAKAKKVEKIEPRPPEQITTEQTAKVQKDVAEAAIVDVTDPAFPTSTKHDSTKEIRERLGLGKVNSKERRSDEEAMAEAIKRKIPQKAGRIADEINAGGTERVLSDIEDAGMRIALAELEIEHEQLMDLIGKEKDDATTKTLSVEADRVENELQSLFTALETSGSEAGRALRARKVQIGRDFKLTSVLNRAKAAAGKKISKAKRLIFEGLTKRLGVATKKIVTLEQEVRELQAKTLLRRGARRFTTLKPTQRKSTIAGLASDINALLEQGCNN